MQIRYNCVKSTQPFDCPFIQFTRRNKKRSPLQIIKTPIMFKNTRIITQFSAISRHQPTQLSIRKALRNAAQTGKVTIKSPTAPPRTTNIRQNIVFTVHRLSLDKPCLSCSLRRN